MKIIKNIKWFACPLLIVSLVGLYFVYPKLEIVTGYSAKRACSCLYVGGYALESIEKYDLAAFPFSLSRLKLNQDNKEVTATILGLQSKTAKYRNGLGCALLKGKDDYKVERLAYRNSNPSNKSLSKDESDYSSALDIAFDKEGQWEKKTLAMVIMKNGQVVSERYQNGYDGNSKLLGWSMTKSVANLLVGILIKEGQLSLTQDSLYPAWDNDDRAQVQLANLLKMNSGLEWTEQYGNVSDITQGLFSEEDFVSYTLAKPLQNNPGLEWEYASGTSNLLSGIIKRQFESYQDYLNFPHYRLFKVLDLDNPVIETDEAGNYILSSYMWATARDWGKLGQLYLNEGNWDGHQLIDTSYLNWSVEPHKASNQYGAHIWLNLDYDYPSAPTSMYWFSGYEGQYVFINPEENLIVVRLGLSKGPPFDMDAVLKEILVQ